VSEAYGEAVRTSLHAESIGYKTVSFADTGAKDATEYLENDHTAEELVQLINSDWVRMPRGTEELLTEGSADVDLIPVGQTCVRPLRNAATVTTESRQGFRAYRQAP
jgi:hypothetical protein